MTGRLGAVTFRLMFTVCESADLPLVQYLIYIQFYYFILYSVLIC